MSESETNAAPIEQAKVELPPPEPTPEVTAPVGPAALQAARARIFKANLGRALANHAADVEGLQDALQVAAEYLERIREGRAELLRAAREAGLTELAAVLRQPSPHLEPVRWASELRRYGLDPLGPPQPPRDGRTLAEDAREWGNRVLALAGE